MSNPTRTTLDTASATRLPVCPDVDHYKRLAKKRLRQLRQNGQEATLRHGMKGIAEEHGYKNWQEFGAAIDHRNHQAAELQRMLMNGQLRGARSLVHKNRDAITDVAAKASPNLLTRPIPLIKDIDSHEDKDPWENLVTLTLNVVLAHHPIDGLDDCVDLLLQYEPHPDDVLTIIFRRKILARSKDLPADAATLEAVHDWLTNYVNYYDSENY
jgi:hypothetical protein